MKRILLYMMCLLNIGAFAKNGSDISQHRIDCGTWITISATPYEGFYFKEWSDHNTEQVRHIQVNEDATYIAFFAATVCEDSASWPIIAVFDWMIRLDVKKINDMGYYFKPKDVTWYQVVGTVDPLRADGRMGDDIPVGTGYELVIDQGQNGSGDYYAIVNLSAYANAQTCQDLKRSQIAHYASGNKVENTIFLLPNYARPDELVQVVGLNPHETTDIMIYSSLGQFMTSYSVTGETSIQIQAGRTAGCYPIRISSPSKKTTLKLTVF